MALNLRKFRSSRVGTTAGTSECGVNGGPMADVATAAESGCPDIAAASTPSSLVFDVEPRERRLRLRFGNAGSSSARTVRYSFGSVGSTGVYPFGVLFEQTLQASARADDALPMLPMGRGSASVDNDSRN